MKFARVPLVLGTVAMLCSPCRVAATEFATPQSYPAGTSPAGSVIGDFNGDGKPDIAVVNSGSNNVSILLGNGDGTFQAAKNFDVGNSMTNIAVGDFNGDGKLDVAVFLPGNASASVAGEVRILLGNGDGTLQAPKVTALTDSAAMLAAGDFSGDQKADLIVSNLDANSGAATLEILIGNGDGTFQSAQALPSGVQNTAFAVADFNKDGKLDLAIAVAGGAQILLGQGNGTFQPSGTANVAEGFDVGEILAADFNQDGNFDLVVDSTQFHNGGISSTTQHVSIFLGQGDGSFGSEHVLFTGSSFRDEFGFGSSDSITGLWIGDFNGDGFPDLLDFHKTESNPPIHPNTAALELNLSKGDGSFEPLVVLDGLGIPSVVQDLNGDLLDDLLFLDSSNNAVVVVLNDSPTFSVKVSSSAITAQAGTEATDTLTFAEQDGFSAAIQLSCTVTGPAPLPDCSLSPANIPAGANSPISTLTVNVPAPSVVVFSPGAGWRGRPPLILEAGIALLLLGLAGRQLFDLRRRWALAGFLVAIVLACGACGGGRGGGGGVKAKSYTIAVTATSVAITKTLTIPLTVN